MSIRYFPFSSGAGAQANQADWEDMARYWLRPGVISSGGGTAEDLNSLQVVQASTPNMTVLVKSGKAFIQGYFYENDDDRSLAVAANSSGVSRTDLVVLRLTRSTNLIDIAIKAGTTALTQGDADVYEIPLAQITVSNGETAINTVDIADRREFAAGIPTRTYTPTGIVSGTVTYDYGAYGGANQVIGGLSISDVYVGTGAVRLKFFGRVSHSISAGGLLIGVSIDGTPTTIIDTFNVPGNIGHVFPLSMDYIHSGLSVGFHDFEMLWATVAGVASCYSDRRFYVEPCRV